jgi:hypothetical protein
VNKKITKINISFCKKILLTVLLSSVLCLSPVHKSEAALWPAIDPIYKQALETMYDQLQSVIMGALKQAAVKMINQQVNKLVGGTVGAGAMFITNWEDYLVNEPQRQANLYMNDYLSQITMGRGSASSYRSNPLAGGGYVLGASDSKANEGFFGGKVLGEGDVQGEGAGTLVYSDNYYETLLDTGKASTTENKDLVPNYEGSPSQMFASGSFKNMNSYLSGVNNPWAFDVQARNRYQTYLQDQRQQAFAQSVAYHGYLGTTKNGRVVTPGSTIEQAVANAQDIGNKILAAATHPGEMISAIVSQVVTQAIQQGIGTVSNLVDRQVNQVTDKVINTVNTNLGKIGPRALYNGGSSQRISY